MPSVSPQSVSPQSVAGPPVSPQPVSPQPGTPQAVSAPTTAAPATVAAEDDGGGTPGLKPAKVLFGGAKTPAPLAARAIGSYAKGCLSGAKALPVDGPDWQAMRLSRNRNWGHPRLIAMVQRLAKDGREKDGWPGLLVGDISQPRGGPMLTGHASHQIGLDADIWLTPMPDRRLSNEERETLSATSMLADDAVTVAREKWTEGHLNIMKRAASYPEVERVLVHPAIKQVLCFAATGDRGWLAKVRPYWGHHYHFHVRMACPPGSEGCVAQAPPPGDDGCGKELDDWLKRVGNAAAPQPIPVPPTKPVREKPPITLDQLPDACRVVLATGNPEAKADVAAASTAAARIAAEKAAAEKAARNKPVTGSKGTAAKSSTGTSTVTKANAKATDIPIPPPGAAAVPPLPAAAANQTTAAPSRE
ncbi:MAG: penicillin-insensitive murein endopeptidase [Hyphomicrobiaceae bacterium]|nr:penicillin-insensitive murein endopeptidase [Hyphomicrobiaceae bacterium]